MIFFFGMKILWIFFGGHHKIGLYLVVISMHFRVFSFQGTEWGIFFGVAKFQIYFFWWCLKFLIWYQWEGNGIKIISDRC